MTELGIAIEPPSFGKNVMRWWATKMNEANHYNAVIRDKYLISKRMNIKPVTAEHVLYHQTEFGERFRERFFKAFGFDMINGYQHEFWSKKCEKKQLTQTTM